MVQRKTFGPWPYSRDATLDVLSISQMTQKLYSVFNCVFMYYWCLLLVSWDSAWWKQDSSVRPYRILLQNEVRAEFISWFLMMNCKTQGNRSLLSGHDQSPTAWAESDFHSFESRLNPMIELSADLYCQVMRLESHNLGHYRHLLLCNQAWSPEHMLL